MQATPFETVTGNSKTGTTSGDEQEAGQVIDVTADILGERRQDWREGFDQGLREGGRRVIHSDVMAQISLELTVNRAVTNGLLRAAEHQEKLLAHWKAEARWWREEYTRLQEEFTLFTRELLRRRDARERAGE